MVHVWHFICQPIVLVHPETNNLRLWQTPNPCSACSDLRRIFFCPEKKKFQVQLFGRSLLQWFIHFNPQLRQIWYNPAIAQRSCRVSLGHENQRSEGPCAMRSTPHSHGNLATLAMEIYEFTLLDFLFGWWMDACVFSRSFFPMVPYVYSKVRPQSNVGLERSWVETASAENNFPGCFGGGHVE